MLYKMMMTVAALGLVSAIGSANADYLLTADPVQVDGQNFGDATAFTIKIAGITDGDLLNTEGLGYAPFTINRGPGDALWSSYVPDAAFDNTADEFTGAYFVPAPTWGIGIISLTGVAPAGSEITLGVLTVSAGNSSSLFSLTPNDMTTAAASRVTITGSTFEVNVVPEPALGLALLAPCALLVRYRRK